MKVNALKWAVWSENEFSKPRVLAYFQEKMTPLNSPLQEKAKT